MSSFTRPLEVRQIGENEWEILKPFVYWIGEEGSGEFVYIDKGFRTDFASVPRFLQWAVPKYGHHNHPSVIHDFLYRYQFFWSLDDMGNARRLVCDRKKADIIHYQANELKGVGWLRRRLIFHALRIGGWVAWDARDKYDGPEIEHIQDIVHAIY